MKLAVRFMLMLLLVGSGVYAGLLLSYSFGMYPVLKFMPLRDYAAWWHTHDRIMGVRTVQYMHWMWLTYGLTLALMFFRKRFGLMTVVALSLVLSLSEGYVYHYRQIPIDRHLTEIDSYTVDENVIADIKRQTFHVLKPREWLAGASFLVLAFGVAFSGYRGAPE